jgi:hypothetical protein
MLQDSETTRPRLRRGALMVNDREYHTATKADVSKALLTAGCVKSSVPAKRGGPRDVHGGPGLKDCLNVERLLAVRQVACAIEHCGPMQVPIYRWPRVRTKAITFQISWSLSVRHAGMAVPATPLRIT